MIVNHASNISNAETVTKSGKLDFIYYLCLFNISLRWIISG